MSSDRERIAALEAENADLRAELEDIRHALFVAGEWRRRAERDEAERTVWRPPYPIIRGSAHA